MHWVIPFPDCSQSLPCQRSSSPRAQDRVPTPPSPEWEHRRTVAAASCLPPCTRGLPLHLWLLCPLLGKPAGAQCSLVLGLPSAREKPFPCPMFPWVAGAPTSKHIQEYPGSKASCYSLHSLLTERERWLVIQKDKTGKKQKEKEVPRSLLSRHPDPPGPHCARGPWGGGTGARQAGGVPEPAFGEHLTHRCVSQWAGRGWGGDTAGARMTGHHPTGSGSSSIHKKPGF